MEKVLEKLGYKYYKLIDAYRLGQHEDICCNVIEINLSAGTICTAYGYDEWVCDELIKLMQAIKEANEWE